MSSAIPANRPSAGAPEDCPEQPDAAPRAAPRLREREPAGDSDDTARVLQTLLGNLDGMVYRCRNDAYWTMEFVSEGCSRVTGYTPEDLLLNDRLSYEELTHPEDRARVRREINEALAARRRFELEYRIQ